MEKIVKKYKLIKKYKKAIEKLCEVTNMIGINYLK